MLKNAPEDELIHKKNNISYKLKMSKEKNILFER